MDQVREVAEPWKDFFLKLAAESVRQLNNERDANGLTYARKAMIGCGLSLSTEGIWKKEQLFQHLQDIVDMYPDHFNGVVEEEPELEETEPEAEE